MRLIWSVLPVSVLFVIAAAQPSLASKKSPKTVVEEFWKMDTEGGRLTEAGWRAADAFFVRPVEPPEDKVILVIDKDFSVWDPTVKGTSARVIVGGVGIVWKLN